MPTFPKNKGHEKCMCIILVYMVVYSNSLPIYNRNRVGNNHNGRVERNRWKYN